MHSHTGVSIPPLGGGVKIGPWGEKKKTLDITVAIALQEATVHSVSVVLKFCGGAGQGGIKEK